MSGPEALQAPPAPPAYVAMSRAVCLIRRPGAAELEEKEYPCQSEQDWIDCWIATRFDPVPAAEDRFAQRFRMHLFRDPGSAAKAARLELFAESPKRREERRSRV